MHAEAIVGDIVAAADGEKADTGARVFDAYMRQNNRNGSSAMVVPSLAGVMERLDFNNIEGCAVPFALYLLERRELGALLRFVSFFDECATFSLVHIRGRARLLLGDLDGAVDDFTFAMAAYDGGRALSAAGTVVPNTDYLHTAWLQQPELHEHWDRCTERGQYLMQCHRLLCESTTAGHSAVAVAFARFALGCVRTREEHTAAYFWAHLCRAHLASRDYANARFAALANPLPKETRLSLKAIVAAAFEHLDVPRLGALTWPGYDRFVVDTILHTAARADIATQRAAVLGCYEAVCAIHQRHGNHRGAAVTLYRAAERLAREPPCARSSAEVFAATRTLYERAAAALEIAAAAAGSAGSQFFVLDEDAPRQVYGPGLEEYALAQAARKRAAPGAVPPSTAACDDRVSRAMAQSREKNVRDIEAACARLIMTPRRLHERVVVATVRERLAAHILQHCSTVILTESEPAQLYPLLLHEHMFDTAALLVSVFQLPSEPLFRDLARQHLHDAARRTTDVPMDDDTLDGADDDPLPPVACEYARMPECGPGRELEYYLARYGRIDDYATVAQVVLASITNAALPDFVADHLQTQAPWLLVDLLTRSGRLSDAVTAACKMVSGDATLQQRLPLQCVDELLRCLDRRAKNSKHPDNSAQLAKTLRDAVQDFCIRRI